jgi:hypothetical protein
LVMHSHTLLFLRKKRKPLLRTKKS